MGADFIATGIWRRGTVVLTDDEIATVRAAIDGLTADVLKRRLPDHWSMLEEDGIGNGISEEDASDPVRFAAAIVENLKADITGHFDWLVDVALKGGDRGVGGMRVGPYEVLLMGEMSWGDLSDEQEGLGLLADSGVLQSVGFFSHGYPSKPGDIAGFGEVFSAVLDCIAERHEVEPAEVVKRAIALDLNEGDLWMNYLGYAVDKIDDELQREETWPDE